MNFSGSFKPMAKFEELMKMMRNAPIQYMLAPMMLLPLPALAEDRMAPPGFEELT